MAPGDYASVGSGKLKLKGVKDSKVDKKKKKSKSKPSSTSATDLPGNDGDGKADDDSGFQDRSVMLKNLRDEDERLVEDERRRRRKAGEGSGEDEEGKDVVSRREQDGGEGENDNERVKTEAERRYEEQRRRRVSGSLSYLLYFSVVSSQQLLTRFLARGTVEARGRQDTQGTGRGVESLSQQSQ